MEMTELIGDLWCDITLHRNDASMACLELTGVVRMRTDKKNRPKGLERLIKPSPISIGEREEFDRVAIAPGRAIQDLEAVLGQWRLNLR